MISFGGWVFVVDITRGVLLVPYHLSLNSYSSFYSVYRRASTQSVGKCPPNKKRPTFCPHTGPMGFILDVTRKG